jgi:hypothetical protein
MQTMQHAFAASLRNQSATLLALVASHHTELAQLKAKSGALHESLDDLAFLGKLTLANAFKVQDAQQKLFTDAKQRRAALEDDARALQAHFQGFEFQLGNLNANVARITGAAAHLVPQSSSPLQGWPALLFYTVLYLCWRALATCVPCCALRRLQPLVLLALLALAICEVQAQKHIYDALRVWVRIVCRVLALCLVTLLSSASAAFTTTPTTTTTTTTNSDVCFATSEFCWAQARPQTHSSSRKKQRKITDFL